MTYRVNTDVKKELSDFGIHEWNECFHCGNCTAICPLTEQGFLFPRRGIRYVQMGLKDKLVSSVDPWLCYYCGECTETCPRDANPAEIMMSLRRYLTSLYDWTGLSKKFYISKIWELGAIMIIALLVILLFVFLGPSVDTTLNSEGGVKLNAFAPIKWI
jgi:heterodisulfide reductase subunit C/quinone-modifying oxidoreductase subunit QmoC